MDVKEVELRTKALSKAIAENEPSASLLKILGDLKTGVKTVTEDLLRQTRVGITVNKLRTNKDPQVAKLAQELVLKWRDEVKKKSAVKARPTNGTGSPAPGSGTGSPAPAKKKHHIKPEERNHKTDKVDYHVTGVDARDSCVRLMYDGLAHMSDERRLRVHSFLCAALTVA